MGLAAHCEGLDDVLGGDRPLLSLVTHLVSFGGDEMNELRAALDDEIDDVRGDAHRRRQMVADHLGKRRLGKVDVILVFHN